MDEITTLPDMMGPVGRYWKLTKFPSERSNFYAMYLVEAPFAHPIWHSYLFSLVDLVWRPGDASLNIHLEGATHEFVVTAMHPSISRQKLIEGDRTHCIQFTPANFLCHFIAINDDDAERRMLRSIQEVINGTLSPDTDFRAMWVQRWNDSGINKS